MTQTTSTHEGLLGWLALTLAPGMGPTRTLRAVRHLGAPARLWSASLTEIEGAGLPATAAQFCYDGRGRKCAEEEVRRVLEQGAALVTPDMDAYPGPLLEIYDPPTVLWVRGNVAALSQPGIGVVGTRHPTLYGAGMAEMLSRDLARRGLAIFSGMARGVDTAAHKGALAAGGVTVAVWGTGIDVIYPKENKRLAEEIVASGGAIVSEFPIGTWEDIWEDLPSQVRLELERRADEQAASRGESRPGVPASLFPGDAEGSVPLGDHERLVLQHLRPDDSLQLEDLLERLEGELASGEVFTALFELELAGRVKQMPGKHYVVSL